MNKTVLVTYASHKESTADIASAIGEHLTHRGYEADVRAIASAPDTRLYSAVVVGSALHLGHWDRDAVAYLKHQAADLAERPTWLFQSEPCEAMPDTVHTAIPHAVHKLCFGIGIQDPVTFGGTLEPTAAKGHLARWMAGSHAETGEFRDWHEVSQWADGVADQLDASRTLLGV
jgi:menaquinone-dependent protoporphyrinogen oxidase